MANILVTDDSVVIQRVICHTLQKHGHRVVMATNGREALQCLEQGPMDLAVIDFFMPEMDGLTLLRALRADAKYKDLPIIMLTASGHDEDRITARSEGASDFLSKPASSMELMEAVNRLLAH